MKCPTCGFENADGAQQCEACGQAPLAPENSTSTVEIKVSRIAIASSICVLVAAISFLPSLITYLDPRVLQPQSSNVLLLTPLITFLAKGVAFLLGVVSLFQITTSGGRRTGYVFGAVGAAGPFLFMVVALYLPTLGYFKGFAFRMDCGTNLSGIGKAMLIYANDYEDRFPLAGGRGTTWAPRLNDWTASSRSEAFGLDPNNAGGQATVSSSLYLLIRHGGLSPKMFVCGGERGTCPFDPNEHHVGARQLTALWDFGPDPVRHCSYSYHMPYGPHKLTTSNKPGMPVAADHNPWMDGARWKASDFSKFQWNGSIKQQKAGNAVAHWLNGQSVLFLDSHVEFAKRAFCGLDNDNIYTLWNGNDKVRGTPPKFGSTPANTSDSLLVNDPVAP